MKEHEGCVNCINFSWDGRLLASSSDDLQVVLWDWGKGSVVGKFESGHVANVFQVKQGDKGVISFQGVGVERYTKRDVLLKWGF